MGEGGCTMTLLKGWPRLATQPPTSVVGGVGRLTIPFDVGGCHHVATPLLWEGVVVWPMKPLLKACYYEMPHLK
jgi:hypothetical protein